MFPPGHVLGNRPTFFLGKAGHDGDKQFTLGIQRPDVFFFKIYLNTLILQLPNGDQAVHGIPCKPAHAFGHNQIDFPGQGICDHILKALTPFCIGGRDSLIRINLDKFPIIPALDVVRIVINLRFIAANLILMIG